MKLFNYIISIFVFLTLSQHVSALDLTACVFDKVGPQGDNYQLMNDFALETKNWDVNLTIITDNKENVIAKRFANKECNIILSDSTSVREYNKFVASIDAIGAVPSIDVATIAVSLLSKPALKSNLKSGDYEVLGVSIEDMDYLMVSDIKINNFDQVANNNMASSHESYAQRLSRQLGLWYGEDWFGKKQGYTRPEKDVRLFSSSDFSNKSDRWKVLRRPISQNINMVVARSNDLPPNFIQKSRDWFASKIPLNIARLKKVDIYDKSDFWIDMSPIELKNSSKIMRTVRMDMMDEGIYDPKMMKILKKIRCKVDMYNFECVDGVE